MVKNILKTNPLTGSVTTIEDMTEGGFLIETKTNVTPIIDYARQQESNYQKGSMIGNTQKHQQKIAEIPMDIYMSLVKKMGEPRQNPKDWKKWLNENKAFRTTTGNL